MIGRNNGGKAPRYGDADKRLSAALVQFMGDTPIQQIKVNKVCKLAGVNRSTFYARFEDVYAAVESLEAAFLAELSQLGEGLDYTALDHAQICLAYLRFFRDNADVLRALMANETAGRFQAAVLEELMGHFATRYAAENPSAKADDPLVTKAIQFTTAGFWGLYLEAGELREEDLEPYAVLAASLSSQGLGGLSSPAAM